MKKVVVGVIVGVAIVATVELIAEAITLYKIKREKRTNEAAIVMGTFNAMRDARKS